MKKEFIVIMVTCPSKREALRIVRTLLERKAVACANILPQIRSHYRWKGRIESARETCVLMKTRAGSFTSVSKLIRSLHSYEVPEIIAIPILDGSPSYLEWLSRETRCA
jgi:periplasmic divalent cation tolerance protein